MVNYLRGKLPYQSNERWWYWLGLSLTALFVVHILFGCSSSVPMQHYENSNLEIKLEYPENWRVDYYERDNSIVLNATSRFPYRNSAHISISGSPCRLTLSQVPDEALEYSIDRIRRLYDLDSITIIQEPVIFDSIDKETINAVIEIPTISIPEDSPANQVGEQSPNVFQVMGIFAIKYSNGELIMAYVYEGNDESLNAEARDIVASIKSTCPAKA